MERRRLAGMKPVSLSHLFFENLSEKTRFWVIVVQKKAPFVQRGFVQTVLVVQ